VLGLALRATAALPVEVAAEIRAVSHCTMHLGRVAGVPESRRCCEITSDADAPATLVQAAPPIGPDTLPCVVAPVVARPGWPVAVHAGRVVRGERDGPPLHVALRSFRC